MAVFFFLPEKMKSARENGFGHFFWFFSRAEFFFSPTFLIFFSGSLKFSRALFRIFSRVDFFFSRAEISEFSRALFFFFSGRIFSAGVKFLLVKSLFAKFRVVVNFCYRLNIAYMPRVSTTGKIIISILTQVTQKCNGYFERHMLLPQKKWQL